MAEDCPFCLGHEADTPPAVLALPDDGADWQVRVVPNKYPAVVPGQAVAWPAESQLGDELPGVGRHEVLIDSPRHIERIAELTVDQLRLVLSAFQRRIAAHYQDRAIQYVQAFKNVGPAAGATIAHAHGQIVGLPLIPPRVADRLARCERWHARQGDCAICHEADAERTWQERIVACNDDFLAYCPHASRAPCETWITPTVHASRFERMGDTSLSRLAETLLGVCRRVDQVLHRPDFNLILHTAPREVVNEAACHWVWELVPRVAQLAGFEWATGCHINTMSPERAAKALRSVEP